MNLLPLSVAILLAAAPAASAVRAADDPDLQRRTDLPPLPYTNAPSKTPKGPSAPMQLPLEPSESAPHLVTRPEFTRQLWAAEPDIVNPLCMAWDERGRLWIAESVDSTNELQEPGPGHDRVKICEDTDGDGRADKFTIFAEKVSIPSGLVFANGGLIVIEGGRTLFLKDNDGDGKADEREVLFEGWGIGDAHAAASNLRYGLDNWIWGTVGSSGFDGSVKRQHVKFGAGVFRFKPDGSVLEFVKAGHNCTRGLGFSEEGFVFGSAATDNPSWYVPIPNRFYEAVSGWSPGRIETIADSPAIHPITDPVRPPEARGRFTAGAGHALYTARNFPSNYWNQAAFVAESAGHLVGQFRLEPRGSDFVAVNQGSFVASDDEWTAPIAAEVGPDGALWVLDGYHDSVPHNPAASGFTTGKWNALETPWRDKAHGRIYRIAWTQSIPVPRLNLAKATVEQLAALLRSDNQLWRLHAQRLMIERGRRDVVPTLFAMARDPAVDALGLNTAAIHALWTLQGMGQRDPRDPSFQNVAIAALRHPSPGVRRAAAAVLPRNAACASGLVTSGVLADPDAHVRLAAFLALAEMPSSDDAGAAIFTALNEDSNAEDRWIPAAATAAAARHDAAFLKAALVGSPTVSPAFSNALRIVTGHFARRAPIESIVPTLLALETGSPAVARPLLDGLAANWPRERIPVLTPADETKLASVLRSLSDDTRSSLLTLADRWGKRGIFADEVALLAKSVRDPIGNAALPNADRIAAARRLVSLADQEDSVRFILGQITPLASPELTEGLLAAIGQSRQPQTGSALIAGLSQFTPATHRAAVATLLRRPEWAAALLNSVEKHDLQRADIAADHWTELKAHPDGAIVVKARELDNFTAGASSPEMEARLRKLLPVARQKGDAAHGGEVFAKSCAACHSLDGQGGKIGPDLQGIGARPRQDILADILDPNRSVEPGYRQWQATTKAGDSFSGRLDAETAASLEILDVTGQKHMVQRADLEALSASNAPIMPADFDQLPEADLAALLEFLTSPPAEQRR